MSIKNELFSFINESVSPYHTVRAIKNRLISNGFSELFLGEKWELSDGGKYFVTKNASSVIAFIAKKEGKGFMISASHTDSPSFKLKVTPELFGAYTRLEVEKYGGMIYYTWLDRPLSIAGRVVVQTEDGIEARLVNIDRDIALIPSVAIHFSRGVNDGYKFNPATDLIPLIASADNKGITHSLIADELGVKNEDIISHDLYLYTRQEARTFGAKDEFIVSPRLDDLECAFCTMKGFLCATPKESVPVLAVFDNEEVGSETKQGAASAFLSDVLLKIAGDKDCYLSMLENSFMVSADNAHAKHPNHPELSDADNAPIMNNGIVIKWNANQKYTTDGVSDAIFKTIAKRCGAKTQNYCNRADMIGGSTLGSIVNTKVSVPTVDIGLPQLAMHSAVETAGCEDAEALVKAMTEFYSTTVVCKGESFSF